MRLYILLEGNNLSDVESGVKAVCTTPQKAVEMMKTIAEEEKDSSWDSIKMHENEKFKTLSFLEMDRKDGAYRFFEIIECLADDFII